MLKSVSGLEMYRKKYGRMSARANIVEFLVMDRNFPRSIHFCISRADNSLRAITGTEAGTFQHLSERLMGLLRADLDFTPVDQILASGLHGYLDGLQIKINDIDNALLSDFVEWHPQTQSQSQDSVSEPEPESSQSEIAVPATASNGLR